MLDVNSSRLPRSFVYVFGVERVTDAGWTRYELASIELGSEHLSAGWGGPLGAGFRRERDEEVLAALGLVARPRRAKMLSALT